MTSTNSASRRYLALWFPFLPADRLRLEKGPAGRLHDDEADPETAPLVFVAKAKGALRLTAVNRQARAMGLHPGMALADARALHPDLTVADMNAEADRHLLERIARHCARWSPRVSLVAPDGIILDTTGVDHLFAGEAGLRAEVEEALICLGFIVRLAAGPTAEAAMALARHARLPIDDERAALQALPVAALQLEDEAEQALRRAGLKCVGDLANRPLSGIAARFGANAVTAIRRLTGEEQAPIVPMQDRAPLRFERRFAEPVGHQASIAACMAELLDEAREVLRERALGGRIFRLHLYRSDGVRHSLEIATGRPTRDPALVLRLFDERIASLADPLDPGFGYDSLILHVAATQPLPPAQASWESGAATNDSLAELIDRLATRLGPGALCRLVPQDSHLPEQAQLALPAITCREPQPWPAPFPGEPPLRPLFLFDPPQPVDVLAEVPDGPPHRFRWKRRLHEVRLYEGPERIGAEWWKKAGGEHPGKGGLTRDYYRIEDVRGRRFWLFRHGLYDEKPHPRWYLHGLFA